MAFHLLERDRNGGRLLSQALAEALAQVGHCKRCRMLTESELCAICASGQRNVAQLCVVESPADVVAIEQSGGFRGRYFVLMGHLSPLDGIGPNDLGLDEFEELLAGGEVSEVILATNPTVEGEATAHYLGELALRTRLRGLHLLLEERLARLLLLRVVGDAQARAHVRSEILDVAHQGFVLRRLERIGRVEPMLATDQDEDGVRLSERGVTRDLEDRDAPERGGRLSR